MGISEHWQCSFSRGLSIKAKCLFLSPLLISVLQFYTSFSVRFFHYCDKLVLVIFSKSLFICLSFVPSFILSIFYLLFLMFCNTLSICLSVCLSVYLSVCRSVILFIFYFLYLLFCNTVCLCIYLAVSQQAYLFVCLSVIHSFYILFVISIL